MKQDGNGLKEQLNCIETKIKTFVCYIRYHKKTKNNFVHFKLKNMEYELIVLQILSILNKS